MGRGKLQMELIRNERSRMVTYHKRKKGLTKKTEEFHILCNVDACVIIFGPKDDVETWPPDRDQILRIIERYRAKAGDDNNVRGKKTQDLSDYFVSRKKKVDDEIAKFRKANLQAKFPAWYNCINLLTIQQLYSLETALDSKLQAAKSRVLERKNSSQKCLIENSELLLTSENGHFNSILNQQPSLLSATNNHGYPPMFQDFGMYVNQMLPVNLMNPIEVNDPLLRLPMNGEEFNHFGSTSTTTNENKINFGNYGNIGSSMTGNMMLNNSDEPWSLGYGNQSVMVPKLEGQMLAMVGSSQTGIMPNFTDHFSGVNGHEQNKS